MKPLHRQAFTHRTTQYKHGLNYHFNIFAKILTPKDIIAAPLELGENFLIKAQMISATLQLKNERATIFQITRKEHIMKVTEKNKKEMYINNYQTFFTICPFKTVS